MYDENDICQRCFNEITDRRRKGHAPLLYCNKCLKHKNRAKQIHDWYRKTHPVPTFKWQKILKALKKKPRTEKELMRITKIKSSGRLRAHLSHIRKKGFEIQPIHIVDCHYILVSKK